MEQIIGQQMREPINLRAFLKEYQQVLSEDSLPSNTIDIKKVMQLDNDETRFLAAEQNCSIDHLEQKNDIQIIDFTPGFYNYQKISASTSYEESVKLESFNKLFNHKLNINRNPFKRCRYNYKMVKQNNAVDAKFDFYYKELLISVRVYRPARATHVGKTIESPVFAEEFQCLGSNLLTELRDKISCICNNKHFYDISEKPDAPPVFKKEDPGYFFITDTFYNDMRNPNNADYSVAVREWAKKAEGLEKINFKVAKMEETRFIDLTISLGFPQQYQHHGNCEHIFVFSQIELVTPSNVCAPFKDYPLLNSFGIYNHRLCNICGRRYFGYIVTGSDRQIHDPAYLCSQCFHEFHFIDGKKVGTFKAYSIFHRNDTEYEGNFEENDSNDTYEDRNDCGEMNLVTFWEGEEENNQVLNINVTINSKNSKSNDETKSNNLTK